MQWGEIFDTKSEDIVDVLYFYVCTSHVFLPFLFLGRLLVLYFSLVVPAICCLFFMYVVCCMCLGK